MEVALDDAMKKSRENQKKKAAPKGPVPAKASVPLAPRPSKSDRCSTSSSSSKSPPVLSDAEHRKNVKAAAQKATVQPGVGARGAKLGMSVGEAIAAVGEKPTDKGTSIVRFDGLNLFFKEGTLERIRAEGSALTASGIGIGASEKQVVSAMGAPEGKRERDWLYPSRGISVFFSKGGGVRAFYVYPPKTPLALAIEPGVGVGPAKLGESCRDIVAALEGKPTTIELGPVGNRITLYRYGSLGFSNGLVLRCDKSGKLFLIDLYPTYAGKTPEGLGLTSSPEELRAAGYEVSRAEEHRLPPVSGNSRGLFVQESCVSSDRVRMLQVVPKAR